MIVEDLTRSDAVSGFSQVSHNQLESWRGTIELTKECLLHPDLRSKIVGVIFEYRVPRREKRIDCILVTSYEIIIIEYKYGAASIKSSYLEQGVDYGLDIYHYHEESHGRPIHVIVCPTNYNRTDEQIYESNLLSSLSVVGQSNLINVVQTCISGKYGNLSVEQWVGSRYRPIPGILDAANMLFANSDLGDIEKCLTSSIEIENVIAFIKSEVDDATVNKKNKLLLVSGVPGSGKTLVGMRLAHSAQGSDQHQFVYTSGNGPLLKVLQESLAVGYAKNHEVTKVEGKRYAQALLHSVHSFIEENERSEEPPFETVIIFDEAQRAWGEEKMEKMRTRQRRFSETVGQGLEAVSVRQVHSEPRTLLEIMQKKPSSVVVALCGNGQEIHDGEAGIDEWVRAANESGKWEIVSSTQIEMNENTRRTSANTLRLVNELHLTVPLRSHRATQHAKWVDATLSGDVELARRLINNTDFPIQITRSLQLARDYLEALEMGSRRYGLLASSGAGRLRAYGIEVSADFRKAINYPLWFTGEKSDFRSSFGLEIAATEFEVQGLELDWPIVAWSWDLMLSESGPKCQSLRGTKWSTVAEGNEKHAFTINKYRVLLTRGREGMLIYIPQGSKHDATRDAAKMNSVASYFKEYGVGEFGD